MRPSGILGFLVACWTIAAAVSAGAEVIDAEVRVGGRAISGDTSGEFNEYRDLEPGAFGSTHFLVESPNESVFLWGDFENVGYEDQRYRIETGQWGRLRLFGEYAELPHLFSTQSRTLYHQSGSNLLLLPDAFQAAVQAAPDNAAKSAALAAGLADARRTSLDYRLRTILGGLVFDPREDLEFETAYRQLDRTGRKPFSLGFGSPGGTFTSFAAPVDEHTDEVTADVRWGRGGFDLEVGYLGSFFQNDLNQVTVDNPLVLTDSAAAASQGRISTAPDNSLNQVHATGTYALPLEFPARIATTFAYGLRQQDDDFLPHTINPVTTGDPLLALPRDSLDGKVQTYLANVLFTARPLPDLDLRGRYRYYDFNNDTSVIDFPAHVVNDQGLTVDLRRNVPNSYERQEADFDVAYRFSRSVRLRGGPFWDQWTRSRDREVTHLDEWGATLALDLKPARWALVRLDYLFGTRSGSGYDSYDYLAATLDPAEVDAAIPTSQLSGLRKFDEADRTRNEIRFLTQLVLSDTFDVSLSGGWAKYDYRNTEYGATDMQTWNVGTEFGYQPLEWLRMSAWYDFQQSEIDQRSRWRPRTFGVPPVVTDDPVNDWTSASTDSFHTLGARVGFVLIPEKLDLDFSNVFEHGVGETHSRGATGCDGSPPGDLCIPAGPDADGGNAPNFPDVDDRLQIFAAVLRYHWGEQLTIEGMFALQKLSVSDYRLDGLNPYMVDSNVNGSGVVSPSLDVFLGNRPGDYDAQIFALSATYRF
jgi:MtrB/PioB family decaheme-associated outer membrane protein